MNKTRRKINNLIWSSPLITTVILPQHAAATTIETARPPCDITDFHLLGALPPNSPNNGWEVSQDGGATWAPYTGSVSEVIGPEGTQRIRLIHDFAYPQTLTLTISGNKFDNGTNDGGSFHLNGVQILDDTGANFTPVSVVVNIPSAGTHIIEWFHGDGNNTIGGTSAIFEWSDLNPSCFAIRRIEQCDGLVRFEAMDGSEYFPTGAEIEGSCPP